MSARQPHEGLTREIDRLQEMAQEWTRLFPQAASQGQHWLKVLSQVRAHVAEDCSRLAVVGTVKSGKSTVINALLGQDLLKRGAGILTAMITRVQAGTKPGAVLRFKEWGEINGEVNRALGFLPSVRLQEHPAPLDLNLSEDRELLAQVLAEAQNANLWAEEGRDPNYLLLKSYLEGYGLIKGLRPASGVLSLAGPDLDRHRELVTREAAAVYLHDVFLTLPFPWGIQGVELGDCQGSDSPIPQHLTQVLAYLVQSDLVLYVISSRVGLRQGDLQFLGDLKRMGLLPHLLAIFNLDLGEHTSLNEVLKLRDRVVHELSLWQADGRLYAFSALKLLLDRRRARGEALDPREEALLSVWALDQEAATFSDEEAARFEQDLQAALKDLQGRRLAGGSLSQVQMVARGLREQGGLTLDLLGRDVAALKDMELRLEARKQPLKATLASLHQALDGAGLHLKKVLKDRVNSLMDRHSGPVGNALLKFIGAYEPDWERLVPAEAPAAFRPVLYQLFQDLVKELAHYVTAELNVAVVEFVRAQEDWLQEELAQVESPLLLSLQEALTLYYREIEALGLPSTPPTLEMPPQPRPTALEVPLLTLRLNPGFWLSGEVWLRSGVGFLERAWGALKRRLGRGQKEDPRGQLLRHLAKALTAIKDWLQGETRDQLVDFGERLKFRYLLPLVDYWLEQRQAALEDTLKSLFADLEGVAGAMRLAEGERDTRRQRLAELVPQVEKAETRLADLWKM